MSAHSRLHLVLTMPRRTCALQSQLVCALLGQFAATLAVDACTFNIWTSFQDWAYMLAFVIHTGLRKVR